MNPLNTPLLCLFVTLGWTNHGHIFHVRHALGNAIAKESAKSKRVARAKEVPVTHG
jgi:hypothetical protein